MIIRLNFALFLSLLFVGFAYSQEDARQILDKTLETYKTLESLKIEGSVLTDAEMNGAQSKKEMTFTLSLKKPNLFLISWKPIPENSYEGGTSWNDGAQIGLSMNKKWMKMDQVEMALGAATGVSGGAAFLVPSIFFPTLFQQNHFSNLKNPKIEKTEKLHEEECFVISSDSTSSKMERFWISKSRFLILQHSRSLESPTGGVKIPELTDAQVEESLKALGQEATPEAKANLKKKMSSAKDLIKNNSLIGSTVQMFQKIDTTSLDKKEFAYAVPSDVILTKSIFGELALKDESTVKAGDTQSPFKGTTHYQFKSKVVKVFKATEGKGRFISYSVKWRDQEVIVSDPLSKTDYKEGDEIEILAMKHENPEKKAGFDLLNFLISK